MPEIDGLNVRITSVITEALEFTQRRGKGFVAIVDGKTLQGIDPQLKPCAMIVEYEKYDYNIAPKCRRIVSHTCRHPRNFPVVEIGGFKFERKLINNFEFQYVQCFPVTCRPKQVKITGSVYNHNDIAMSVSFENWLRSLEKNAVLQNVKD